MHVRVLEMNDVLYLIRVGKFTFLYFFFKMHPSFLLTNPIILFVL